jgi:DNA-binding MltR family transcriptional regulator
MTKFRFEILSAAQDFDREVSSQNDRAIAIASGSYVDCLLQWLLEMYLIRDAKAVSELFKPLQPLSTLSSKINLSYCMGLISKKEYKNIHKVRDIRNIFAHRIGKISFDDEPVSDKIEALEIPPNMYVPDWIPAFEEGLKSISIEIPVFNSKREKYVSFVHYVLNFLAYRYCSILRQCKKSSEFKNAAEGLKQCTKRFDELQQKVTDLEQKLVHAKDQTFALNRGETDGVDYIELFSKVRPYFDKFIKILESKYENMK